MKENRRKNPICDCSCSNAFIRSYNRDCSLSAKPISLLLSIISTMGSANTKCGSIEGQLDLTIHSKRHQVSGTYCMSMPIVIFFNSDLHNYLILILSLYCYTIYDIRSTGYPKRKRKTCFFSGCGLFRIREIQNVERNSSKRELFFYSYLKQNRHNNENNNSDSITF